MPIYESDSLSREELEKKRKANVCKVCGGWLNMFLNMKTGLAYIACNDYLRTGHEGVERQAIPHGIENYNIISRREVMERKFGQEKTRALAKYQMAGIINRDSATEIVETLWKGASPVEKTKAILLCATYNLNPLMNHVFMLPFQNKKTGQTEYVVVIGIEATRLMAHRNHKFTYLDLTPRKAIAEELEKILGKENIKPNTLYVITKGKDLDTGAEGYGLGSWSGTVYGEDKGNSAFNMASIRSERQFFKRMYPAEQPAGIDVVDERFVDAFEGEYIVVDETTGEITEPKPKPHPAVAEKPATDKLATAQPQEPPTEPTTEKKEAVESKTSPEKQGGDGNVRDGLLNFIAEAKGYKTTKTARQYLVQTLHIEDSRIDTEPDKVLEEVKPYFK